MGKTLDERLAEIQSEMLSIGGEYQRLLGQREAINQRIDELMLAHARLEGIYSLILELKKEQD